MDDLFARFGPFKSLFGEDTGYLSLLNLGAAALAVRQLRDAADAAGDGFDGYILELLNQPNWRPQLVAAAALVVSGGSSQCVATLWDALDRPCWTSPQLAAAASRIDPAFVENARRRLERRCPLQVSGLPSMSALERHVAQGPDFATHSVKLASALASLCGQREGHEAWLPALLSDPEFKTWLETDRDDGGDIAVEWLEGLDELTAAIA